jgi:hypothetical protein
MLFKEYDNKMQSSCPDFQYWEYVLMKEQEWENVDSDKALAYTVDQIKELQATDRIECSVYVLGNGGPTDVYANQDTAYKIEKHYKHDTRTRNNGALLH